MVDEEFKKKKRVAELVFRSLEAEELIMRKREEILLYEKNMKDYAEELEGLENGSR